jgi:hypothetical protein
MLCFILAAAWYLFDSPFSEYMFGNCGPRYSLRWWWSDVYLRRFGVWCINKRRILSTTPVCIIDISSLNVIIVHGFESSGPCVRRKIVLLVPSCCFKHLKRKQTQCKEGQTKNSAAGIRLCITKIYSIYTQIIISCTIQVLINCAFY